jgi:hypothetical protein
MPIPASFLFSASSSSCCLSLTFICIIPCYLQAPTMCLEGIFKFPLTDNTFSSKYRNVPWSDGLWGFSIALQKQVRCQLTVFRDVALCSLVGTYLRFRSAYCLYHQSYDLWNVGQLLRDYTAHHHRRRSSSFSRRENLKSHHLLPLLELICSTHVKFKVNVE